MRPLRRWRPLRGVLWHACVWPACLCIAATLRGADAAEGLDVTVGFDGVCRVGAWTPVTVRLPLEPSVRSAEDVRVFVAAEDPDGAFVRSPPARLGLDASGSPTAATTVRLGRPTGTLRIEFGGGSGSRMIDVPTMVPSWQRIVLVVGELANVQRACRLLEREDGVRPRPVTVSDPSALGRTPLDFDAADAIVVCGPMVAGASAPLPESVADAIDGWVRDGGTLLFLAGPTAGPIAGKGAIAATWLPGRFSRLVPLRRTAAVETFAKSTRPLEAPPSAPLLVPLFDGLGESADASIEVFEGVSPTDLPLVVRKAHGFGTIVWAGFEPDASPLRGWQGNDTLLARLLERCLGRQQAARDGGSDRLDLASQLCRAVDTFEGASPVPFEWIAGIAGAYVLALYPLGWWAVEWLRRRGVGDAVATTVAWVLLPATVASFVAVPWAVARTWRSETWLDSRCDLTDLDVEGGAVRGVSFCGAYSPVNASMDLSARPTGPAVPVEEGDAAPVALSWFAASGRGLGGTDAASPHASLAAGDYAYASSLDRLAGIPIAAASSRLFEARWYGRTAEAAGGAHAPGVRGRIDRDPQGTLRGAIESRLPFPLSHGILAYAGWMYDVGRLEPGGTFDPSTAKGPRSLAGSLTRRSANREREIPVRYDVDDRDAARILEIAGFHAASGGPGYTSLEAGRLARLDLSPLLDANRAILVGEGPAPTEWSRTGGRGPDGAGQVAAAETPRGGASVWRIVIPIGRAIGDTDAKEPKP